VRIHPPFLLMWGWNTEGSTTFFFLSPATDRKRRNLSLSPPPFPPPARGGLPIPLPSYTYPDHKTNSSSPALLFCRSRRVTIRPLDSFLPFNWGNYIGANDGPSLFPSLFFFGDSGKHLLRAGRMRTEYGSTSSFPPFFPFFLPICSSPRPSCSSRKAEPPL